MQITIEGTNKNGLPFEAIYTIDDGLMRLARSPLDFAVMEVTNALRSAVDMAVNDDTPLPKSVSTSELVIAGTTLIVHHLDNGQRVIERDSLNDLMEAMGGRDLSPEDQAKIDEVTTGV